MLRRLPGGLRTRLALAISLMTVALVGVSFFVAYEQTGSDIRSRIDRGLGASAGEFDRFLSMRTRAELERPGALETAAKRFVRTESSELSSNVFAIELARGEQVTNQRSLVERELEQGNKREAQSNGTLAGGQPSSEGGPAPALTTAPPGFSTVELAEGPQLRVLTTPILVAGRRVGTFRVADSLQPVTDAEDSLKSTLLIVAAGALVCSAALAVWLAGLISRPLRRISATASEVAEGQMSRRIDYQGEDEVGVLAREFNRMLDRLERAFAREREFASDASHELRTPLTVLRGGIELLAREQDPQARAERAQRMLAELRRIERLVDDMLTLSRADAGTLLRKRPLAPGELIDDIRRDSPLLGDRDYVFSSSAEGTIDADPDRLAQVLRNLVRNAVDHTSPGERVEVAASGDNGALRVTVFDQGPGIPPGEEDRVFDRFHRTDQSRDRSSGGSGLGLPIARAIVEAHGGRIWAEPGVPGGTEMTFEIPGLRR